MILRDSKKIIWFEKFLAAVVFGSLFLTTLETIESFSEFKTIFRTFEYIVASIFAFEYILRLSHSKDKKKYITSFFGIIDLLSFLPTFLSFGSLAFLKTIRLVRVFETIRTVRVLKLSEIQNDLNQNRVKRTYNFGFYLTTLALAVVIFGGLIYLFDPRHELASDLLHSFLWAFKILIGFTPIEETISKAGQFILILTRMTSFILFGFLLNALYQSSKRFFGVQKKF